MSKFYRGAVIALELAVEDVTHLHECARRLAPADRIHLAHVIRFDGDYDNDGFEPGQLEAEYWRCGAYLADWGRRLDIPEERQALLVGPVSERLADYAARQQVGLLVLGKTHRPDRIGTSMDIVQGMINASVDLLVVS